MLVAQIAYLNLDPSVAEIAQAMAAELGPQFYKTPDFVTGACWPDDLKTLGITMYNVLHYIDTPYNPDANYTASEPVAPQNVVWSLEQAQYTFTSPNSAAISYGYQFFIRWVAHAIGDIHQPLHAITLYSQRFPIPAGDLGGNFFKVVYNNTATNLHSLVDSVLFRYAFAPISRPLSPAGAAQLVADARELMERFPASSFDAAVVNSLNVTQWAAESYQLAIQYVYQNGALGFNATISLADGATLRAVLEERIALAGYRLANYLKAYLPTKLPPYQPLGPGASSGNGKTGVSKGAAAGIGVATGVLGACIGVGLALGWQHYRQAAYAPIGDQRPFPM